MGKILVAVFQTIRRNLFLFLFIVLILVSGKMIRNEWIQLQRIAIELPALRSADSKVSEHQKAEKGRITQQLAKMSEATELQLAEEIGVLDNEISLLKRDQKDLSLTSAAMNGSGQMMQALQQQTICSIDLELRLQAKAYLTLLHTHAVVLKKRRAAQQRLEQLRVMHVKVYGELQNTIRQLGQFEADAGMLAKIPFTKSYKQIGKLKEEVGGLKDENNRLYRDYLAQQTVIEHLSLPADLSEFRLNEQRLAEAVAPLRLRVIQAESLAANNFLWLGYQALQP